MGEETDVAARLAAANLNASENPVIISDTAPPQAGTATPALSSQDAPNQSSEAPFTFQPDAIAADANPFLFSRPAGEVAGATGGFSFTKGAKDSPASKSAFASSSDTPKSAFSGGTGAAPTAVGSTATSSEFPSLPPPPATAGNFAFEASAGDAPASSHEPLAHQYVPDPNAPKIQATFTDARLQQMQEDESCPLFSMTTFEELGLPDELLKALRMMNFKKPSRIQCATLPHIMKTDQNVIGQSQSGTGKTACFGLGLLAKIDERLRKPQALVMSPTRELALQITNELRMMARYITGINIIACIPGYDFTGGVMAQVVVGTPGRVKDAMDRRFMASEYIRILVLDEADSMLETQQGGSGGNAALAMQIKKRCPRDCQILLFSATYPQSVRRFCMAFAPNAKKFSIAEARSLNLAYIKQVVVRLPYQDAKFQFLLEIYGFCDINQSVIFCNSKTSAKNLADQMRAQNFAVALLISDMPPEQRDDVLNSFRNQMTRVLIATNVIARGVDVVQVSVVINYELPLSNDRQTPDFDTYLHRIGRCGRFGRPGVAINFACNARESMTVNSIAAHYDVQMRQAHNPEDIKGLFEENDAEIVS